MKKTLFILMVICFSANYLKAQSICASFPCPELQFQRIIQNTIPCGSGVALHRFDLIPGTGNLCSGESFTFTLKNSTGTILEAYTMTSGTVYMNLHQLCSGNYTICVKLNSSVRDCAEQCFTFFYTNIGNGCCPSE